MIVDELKKYDEININNDLLNVYEEWKKENPFDKGQGWGGEPWCQKEMEIDIDLVKKAGCKRIKFMCIIAAPEGLAVLQEKHPDVQVYCASLDEKLNENGYILPGLGDAGDRIFGTK